MAIVGTPTTSGFKEGLKSYGLGALSGFLFQLGGSITGNSFIGAGLAASAVAATVRGETGKNLAAMLGFMGLVGSAGGGNSQPANNDAGVM